LLTTFIYDKLKIAGFRPCKTNIIFKDQLFVEE